MTVFGNLWTCAAHAEGCRRGEAAAVRFSLSFQQNGKCWQFVEMRSTRVQSGAFLVAESERSRKFGRSLQSRAEFDIFHDVLHVMNHDVADMTSRGFVMIDDEVSRNNSDHPCWSHGKDKISKFWLRKPGGEGHGLFSKNALSAASAVSPHQHDRVNESINESMNESIHESRSESGFECGNDLDSAMSGVKAFNCFYCLATLAGHRGAACSVAFAADGRLTIGSWVKTARIWSADGNTYLLTIERHRCGTTSRSF